MAHRKYARQAGDLLLQERPLHSTLIAEGRDPHTDYPAIRRAARLAKQAQLQLQREAKCARLRES